MKSLQLSIQSLTLITVLFSCMSNCQEDNDPDLLGANATCTISFCSNCDTNRVTACDNCDGNLVFTGTDCKCP